MSKLINLPHLADQVFGVPHYATRQIMDSVKSILVPRLQGMNVAPLEMALGPDESPDTNEPQQSGGGVGVIPIHGILVPRRGQIVNMCTELNSYERIRGQLASLLNDPGIKEIVLDINSGGGAVSGCKELADYIYQSRSVKPITAIVNFSAFSAAYFIASACSKIIVSETSGVGSIGVILEHMEASKWEESVGLKFTTFSRGDNKNNGSMHEPLTELATSQIQAMIDGAYQTFTSSVAQYRGIDIDAVIGTQAALYFGQNAVAAGLADEMCDPQSAINAIAAKYKPSPQQSSIQLRAAVMDQQARM